MQTYLDVEKNNGSRLLISSVTALFLVFCLSSIQPAQAFHFPWDQGHDTTEPEDPEDPGPCEGPECENDPCNAGSQGSPVYLATGHFIWSETDIELKGRPYLAVTRTFNSHDPRVGLLGNGWSMSCDNGLLFTVRYEVENNTNTQVREFVRRLPNGKRYIYAEQADGTFAAPGLFDVVTRQTDNTARLQFRDTSYSIYSELGRLQSEVDRNGNTVNYTYDAQGRLTQKADTNGRSLSYEYSTTGVVSVIRDHTGREWQYGYDADANLISITDPLEGVRQYEYTQHQPVGDGNTYSHMTKVTDETDVVETEVTYSGTRVASYKEYENTFTYQYDTANRRVTKTDSQNSQWIFTYNQTGQFTEVQAPLNRTTVYDRDADSLLTRLVDPSGTEYSYTYDQFSNRLTETDDRGTVTTTYDNEKPWPLTIASRSGRITTVVYDNSGNPLTVTDSSGAVTTIVWSSQGDVQQVTDALGNQAVLSYSNQGLPLTSTDPLSRTTQYQYDELNNNTQMTNPAGEVMQYQYDDLDRVTIRTDANGDVTLYNYDAADRITQVTAPSGQSVQYIYDSFGRLSQRTFYDGTTYTYQYRSDNLASQVIRPDNVFIVMSYDAAKRPTQRTIGSEDTYTYTYNYNLRDELTNTTNNTGAIALIYDAFGRISSETVNGEASIYQYNVENETTQLTNLGIAQSQQFDVRGLLSQLDTSGVTYQYNYDAIAQLVGLTRTAVANSNLQYNSANELTQINHGTGKRSYQYEYDDASRISQWQGVAGETRDYSYDNTGRLINVQSTSNPEAFNYDSMGNRQNNNAQFDVANRITEDNSFNYFYDINGNRIEKVNKVTGEVERYTYNSLDQFVRYQVYPDSDPATVPTTDYNYAYGPLGRRWSKQNNLGSGTSEFYWSGSSLIGENNNGTLRRYILEGLTPTGFVENGVVYHYLKDHLGAAHEIIDSNDNIVWQANYDSFGNVVESVNNVVDNRLRLPGQYFDSESQLYYNHYRYYDPQLGSYTQSDPIGLLAGLNSYSYVLNNPLNYSDPQGLCAGVCTGIGIGIGLGIRWGASRWAARAAARAAAQAAANAMNNESAEDGAEDSSEGSDSDTAQQCPVGSKPIDQTPWSGDHQGIKEGIGAGPADNTKIDPDDNVWGENPDGSWTNHGPAGNFTGSGKPSGRKGKDRRRKW